MSQAHHRDGLDTQDGREAVDGTASLSERVRPKGPAVDDQFPLMDGHATADRLGLHSAHRLGNDHMVSVTCSGAHRVGDNPGEGLQ